MKKNREKASKRFNNFIIKSNKEDKRKLNAEREKQRLEDEKVEILRQKLKKKEEEKIRELENLRLENKKEELRRKICARIIQRKFKCVNENKKMDGL